MLVIGAMFSAYLSSSPAAAEDFGRDFLAEIGGMLRGFGAFGWGFHLQDSKCNFFVGEGKAFWFGGLRVEGASGLYW